MLKFNTVENIRTRCPQSNLNCVLLCTVNFAVKLLFLSGFCMIYCVDLGEGNVRKMLEYVMPLKLIFSVVFAYSVNCILNSDPSHQYMGFVFINVI
jgi:hypothetical protein